MKHKPKGARARRLGAALLREAVRQQEGPPHTVTITIPEELGELVASGLALRDADNAFDLIAASKRFHTAISGLLQKRKAPR